MSAIGSRRDFTGLAGLRHREDALSWQDGNGHRGDAAVGIAWHCGDWLITAFTNLRLSPWGVLVGTSRSYRWLILSASRRSSSTDFGFSRTT
jgi:hypothetical protein